MSRMVQRLLVGGIWLVEHWRKGVLLSVEELHNLVPTEGINFLLTTLLKNGTPIDPWYVAIFESNTTILATHTYAVPGYTESTAYDEATRPEFVDGVIAGGAVSNSGSKAVFTINATKTIYGAALVGGGTDGNTKGDTAGGGTELCACKFTAGKAVEAADVLNVQYTFTAADDGV